MAKRRIHTLDRHYKGNTLDTYATSVLRSLIRLPTMINPSHSTGKAEYVLTTGMAAVATGADSLMIEVHPNLAKALSDEPQ